MADTMLTRTAFCPRCQKVGRPSMGDLYIAYGRTSGVVYVLECEERVKAKNYGFTPHLFILTSKEGSNLVVHKSCGMDGCGIVLYENNNGDHEYMVNNSSIISMTSKEWNNLVRFTNTGYEL